MKKLFLSILAAFALAGCQTANREEFRHLPTAEPEIDRPVWSPPEY